jgi:hypothetical protein
MGRTRVVEARLGALIRLLHVGEELLKVGAAGVILEDEGVVGLAALPVRPDVEALGLTSGELPVTGVSKLVLRDLGGPPTGESGAQPILDIVDIQMAKGVTGSHV